MTQAAGNERIGINSGNGMAAGAALGVVFTPMFGALALIFGALIGLVAGAAFGRDDSSS